MNYIYRLNFCTLTDEAGAPHVTYGIDAYEKNSTRPVRTVYDIFSEREAAERFVEACNILCLDIEHLDDVVFDAVNS